MMMHLHLRALATGPLSPFFPEFNKFRFSHMAEVEVDEQVQSTKKVADF